jgi:hypothetical protein
MTIDVRRRLAEFNWPYAQQDPDAKAELARRIEVAARRQELLTYSELIGGVSFCLPNVNVGRPFEIDPLDWSELHRTIIGDFLGCISAETYERAGIFVSAIVVTKQDGTPGPGFTQFMRDLGVLSAPSEDAATECWVREVQRVYAWYRRQGH